MESDPKRHPAQSLTLAVLAFLLGAVSCGFYRLERSALIATDYDDTICYGVLPCSEKAPPSLANIEEYDWAYCSLDLAPLWSTLHIVDRVFTDSSSVLEAFSAFGDLDRDGKNERILRLTLNSDEGQAIRFVVLKRGLSPRQWFPFTYFDIPDFHLAPEARVVTNGRASWLVIEQHEHAWDDQLRQENQTWYGLSNGRLTEVLTFPADIEAHWPGHSDLQETIKTRVEVVPSDGSEDRVNVAYEVTLSWNGRHDPVTVSRKVSFSRKAAAQRFAFDLDHSEIREDVYERIFDAALHRPTDRMLMEFASER